MRSFFVELKRRRVYGAAAFYAAAAWLLVQVAGQVFPLYGVSNAAIRWLITALLIGFPVAMLISWRYQWAPAGWRREDENAVPTTPALAPSNSIAVLPFVDMSPEQDQEYFSDGLSEELLNLLVQLPQLQVIARTSSFSFKGKGADITTIARTLNVAHLLEGSVRKSGNTLRVTAQLIRAADSSHLWSQSYDRELTDVFRVQDDIAGAVVDALKVKLLPSQHMSNAHRTSSTEAYEQFLIGQNVFRRGRYDENQRALVAFQRAVALDPRYGAAYAGLANAQSAVADFATTPELRSAGKLEALATAEKAIALAPNIADGYVIRGHLRKGQLWDWDGALADFRRALELEPGNADVLIRYALALSNLLRMDEALVTVRRAIEADPLAWLAWMLLGAILQRLGRIDEARAAIDRALQISPDSSFARDVLGTMHLVDGRTQEALVHFREAGAALGSAGIAKAEFTLGHECESLAALAELESKYSAGFAYQIAQVHAWRGEVDQAFAWLERAFEQHDGGIARLRGEPLFDALKDDPRYLALLRKMNFPL